MEECNSKQAFYRGSKLLRLVFTLGTKYYSVLWLLCTLGTSLGAGLRFAYSSTGSLPVDFTKEHQLGVASFPTTLTHLFVLGCYVCPPPSERSAAPYIRHWH